MKTVVVGGTGLVGSRLVDVLRGRGVEAVVAAKETGVDVLTGEGLSEALKGADVVVDVLNVVTMDVVASTRFFQTAARNIAEAERSAGVSHHVLLSIVGLERAPENGYYVGKIAQEDVVKDSGVPYSILRSTQFFEYLSTVADWSRVCCTNW